jgi:hypothetical protein
VVEGAGRKAKRMVLHCINGVGSNLAWLINIRAGIITIIKKIYILIILQSYSVISF